MAESLWWVRVFLKVDSIATAKTKTIDWQSLLERGGEEEEEEEEENELVRK
jgi:hypothetical protein